MVQKSVNAEVTEVASSFDVTAAAGSAGQSPGLSDRTAYVQLARTRIGGPIEYKLGAGAWQTLEAESGIKLDVDLSKFPLMFRKASSQTGPVPVNIIRTVFNTLIIDGRSAAVDVSSAPATVVGSSGLGNVLQAVMAPGWNYTGVQWKTVTGSGVVANATGAGATTLNYTQVAFDLVPGTTVYPEFTGLQFKASGITAGIVAPGAPTIGAPTGGTNQATFAYTISNNNGGSPILGHELELEGSTTTYQAASAASTSITVTGLPGGVAVRGRVRSYNAAGPSSWSAYSTSVTPAGEVVVGLPSVPRTIVATAGDGSVAVTWVAPADNGGSPILGYRLSWPGATPVEVGVQLSGSITQNVANGVQGKVTVEARNAQGYGPAGESNSVTPQSSAPVLRAAAPTDLRLTGIQNSGSITGRVNMGDVSLGTQGDWSLYLTVDKRTDAVNMGGGLISIGDQSDNIFSAASSLVLGVNGAASTTGNYWSLQSYYGALQLFAQDDANNCASSRYMQTEKIYPGPQQAWPLFGQGFIQQAGATTCGILVCCRSGVIELWVIDPAGGARLFDAGPGLTAARDDNTAGVWTGITNKPMVLGTVNIVNSAAIGGTTRHQYWGGPLSQVVLFNGGCITPQQAAMLANGVDARDVLAFDAARGDRYWPGSAIGGQMEELVAGQHGTIAGTGTSFASTVRPTFVDECSTVFVQHNGVRQADNGATTNLVVWGNRYGTAETTEIQMRLLSRSAPFPAAAGDVLKDWTTVATEVGRGPWSGTLPNVDNQIGAATPGYFVEVRSKKADGSWTDPRRSSGALLLGEVVCIMGQSIMQQMMDRPSTAARNTPAAAVGRFALHTKFCPVGSRNRSSVSYLNGWALNSETSFTTSWGMKTFASQLAAKTGRAAGVLNLGQSGSSIGWWQNLNGTWGVRARRFIQETRAKYIIFNNGHGDAGMSKAERFAAQDAVLAGVKSAVNTHPAGAWTFVYLVLPVTNDFNSNLDSIRGYDIEWALQRKSEGEPVDIVSACMDLAQGVDGTHPDQILSGQGITAERFCEDIAFRAGYAPGPGLGGRISAGTWSYAGGNVTAVFPIVGGVAPHVTGSGGAPTGFGAYTNLGNASGVTVSLSNSQVTMVFATASEPTYVDITYQQGFPGAPANPSTATTRANAGTDNAIYDTRAGLISGLPGMPLLPITNQNRVRATKAA